MLDPSLQFIYRVILFQLSHLSSFLYLFPLSYFCSFRPPYMDSYPFSSHSKFVELLSQQTLSFGNNEDSVELSSSQVPFQSSLGTDASNYGGDTAAERKGRRKWTPTDDVVLISSWLNTSKDPVVGNEQKSFGFWKRIAAYFAASPLVAGCEEREPSHCKQ